MATGIAITDKTNARIDAEVARLSVRKEAYAHAVFLEAPQDAAFTAKVVARILSLGNRGSEALEGEGH